MAKVRNVSADTLELRLNGGEWAATAEPDAVVEVPDDLYEQHAWPEELWAVVSTRKTKNEGK